MKIGADVNIVKSVTRDIKKANGRDVSDAISNSC